MIAQQRLPAFGALLVAVLDRDNSFSPLLALEPPGYGIGRKAQKRSNARV
jgi:hypothetical protein